MGMIAEPVGWPAAELAALAERLGALRAAAAALPPDADWDDAAAHRFAERAAELQGALATAEASASALAAGAAA